MTYLRGMVSRALAATALVWPPVRVAFGWVHQAAHLRGQDGCSGEPVRRQLGGLLGAMTRHRDEAGPLAKGVDHFVRVSRSYWPGLFACYDTPDLPRTNNHLEQAFGSHRHHERRASGRKGASPSLVLRGAVKGIVGLATRAGGGDGGAVEWGRPGGVAGQASRVGRTAVATDRPPAVPPRSRRLPQRPGKQAPPVTFAGLVF